MPNHPMLFDGAFGTYYLSLTGDERPCEYANLYDPQMVLRIHREYLAAGVNAIKTNTFAANPTQFPDRQMLDEVIGAGWRLAKQAAGDAARVFADLGGNESVTAQEDSLAVADCFLRLGATDFLFETLSELTPALPAIREIRRRCADARIHLSFAVSPDGYTRKGLHYRALFAQAWAEQAIDAVGLNCVCGPSHLGRLAKGLGICPKPFSAMPNAGYPSMVNGRMVFEDNADYFAERLCALYLEGADILGGCCGSTPRHLALAIARIRAAERPEDRQITSPPPTRRQDTDADWFAPKGKKLLAVELDPPLNADCSKLLAGARRLRDFGVDLITIADSPLARARADSVMTAAKLHRETGVEVLAHICCRDKNQTALKAALLGASFEGVRRVLAITGDPPIQSEGGRPNGVFSFNSYDLIGFIESLNQECFAEEPFWIAGALNVNAVNFSIELERARQKLSRGARMLLTQPIFSAQAVENFHTARRALDCKLLAGILPVAGYKNAVFLVNEVSGIEIPAAVIESLRDKSPEQAAKISIAYSANIARQVYAAADGFYLMTPLGKVEIVRGLMEEIAKM